MKLVYSYAYWDGTSSGPIKQKSRIEELCDACGYNSATVTVKLGTKIHWCYKCLEPELKAVIQLLDSTQQETIVNRYDAVRHELTERVRYYNEKYAADVTKLESKKAAIRASMEKV